MEKESNRPHLAQKTLDPGAGLETFVNTATKSAESGFAPA